MSTVNIPRLDLNNYINGDAAARKQFSALMILAKPLMKPALLLLPTTVYQNN
jgi:hypothetical protein